MKTLLKIGKFVLMIAGYLFSIPCILVGFSELFKTRDATYIPVIIFVAIPFVLSTWYCVKLFKQTSTPLPKKDGAQPDPSASVNSEEKRHFNIDDFLRANKNWLKFLVCLFFGWLGVHKFIERKIGMGLLYFLTGGLFFVGWIYDVVHYLIAAIKDPSGELSNPVPAQRQLSVQPDGALPVIFDPSVLLLAGEMCHYTGNATQYIPKSKVVGYTGGSSGFSFRIAKGVTYRTGSSRGKQVREKVVETHPGKFVVTNMRVIFMSADGGFDKKIDNMTMLTPADDGIIMQFSSQIFTIGLGNDANYVYQMITYIYRQRRAGKI